MRQLIGIPSLVALFFAPASMANDVDPSTSYSSLEQPLIDSVTLRSFASISTVKPQEISAARYRDASANHNGHEQPESSARDEAWWYSNLKEHELEVSSDEARARAYLASRSSDTMEEEGASTQQFALNQPSSSTSYSSPSTIHGETYGPIQANETLWSIVAKIKRPAHISHHALQQAILNANPHAFIDGDIHQMIKGVTLTIPQLGVKQAIKAPATKPSGVNVAEKLSNNLQQTVENISSAELPKTSFASVDMNGPARTTAQRPLLVTDAPKQANVSQISDDLATENGRQPLGEWVMALQHEIQNTVNRVDKLQSSHDALTSKMATVESRQEKLESHMQLNEVMIAKIETRLATIAHALDDMATHTEYRYAGQAIHANSSIINNPLLPMFGIGVLASGLIGGMWWLRRHRQATVGAKVTAETPITTPNTTDEASDAIAVDSTRTPRQLATGDVTAEIATLIHNQDYATAKQQLNLAIRQAPARVELYLKLLEVYAGLDDQIAFERTYQYMLDNLKISDNKLLQTIHTIKAITWPLQKSVAFNASETANDHTTVLKHEYKVANATNVTNIHALAYAPGNSNPLSDVSLTDAIRNNFTPSATVNVATQNPSNNSQASFKLTGLQKPSGFESHSPLHAEKNMDSATTNESEQLEQKLDLARTYIQLNDYPAAIKILTEIKLSRRTHLSETAAELLSTISVMH